jgi:hypothetical protein
LRGAFQPKQSFNFQGIASLRNARNDTIKINLNEYTYTTGNGKTFDAELGGVNSEFAEGEKVCEWLVCHEYGHFLGLIDLDKNLGTYSLMQNRKVNDSNEGVTPLSVKDVTDLGWLDMNDATRVQTVTANTSVTLQSLRSPTGIVAAKILPDPNFPYIYFLIANHQRSTNVYDGTYPADGLLIWHIEGISYTDIECAVGTDPIANGFNKDHLDLPQADPNYHGEGLASDFFIPSGQNQFTPWTNPNTDYSGSSSLPTNLAITNIASNSTSMSFDVIYNFFSGTITADSWWKNSQVVNGNVTVNSGKTVTLVSGVTTYLDGNFTLTINPGATLYVDGTLNIGRNMAITGGGSIVKGGSGQVLVTYSASALASNNSRKVARDANGNYHLVFETVGEVCYEKLINGGTAIGEFKRLSAGLADGVKSNPAICVRDNNVFVVWQKNTGSSHDITFHKSTDGGATWPGGNRKVLATNVGANPPLPVIVSPAANQLMVVYRTASNLSYQTSSDDGNTWSAATAVPSTGSNAAYPSMAVTSTYWGSARTALVNTNTSGNGTIYYRYYKNGPDSTGWASLLKNLSQIVPGSYTGHQKPSIAPSGTAGNKRLHVAWEATIASNGERVIVHRKATDWVTWPTNEYSVLIFSLNQPQLPSITGLANDSAELLQQGFDLNNIYKRHYNGSTWGGTSFIAAGTNPSVSVGNTTARYIWTSGSTAPYEIKTSSETLSKTASPLATAYHRSIAIIDTTTNAWLEVRLNKLSVKTRHSEEFTMPFVSAKGDSLTLTPANAFTNLASSPVVLPADAESLAVYCQVSGQGLSAIKNAAKPITVEIVFTGKKGATLRLPIINISADGLAETKISSARGITALAGGEISVRTEVAGFRNKSSLIASLGQYL